MIWLVRNVIAIALGVAGLILMVPAFLVIEAAWLIHPSHFGDRA